MREYSTKISLTHNSRGVYSLDPIFGCASGMAEQKAGCYGDCYAAKSAKLYGYDFKKNVLRSFQNPLHLREVTNAISRIPLDFVRMGTMGEPSEDWAHTVGICKLIADCNKEIVIITRHWNVLTNAQLDYFSRANVCINTSVSALDKSEIMARCLAQYERIKPFCKSVLRVITCDFNQDNEEGKRLSAIQDALLDNDNVLETVLRLNKRNPLVKGGIVNIRAVSFLGKKQFASKRNSRTYLGKCGTCTEMCGVKIGSTTPYAGRPGILKQLELR